MKDKFRVPVHVIILGVFLVVFNEVRLSAQNTLFPNDGKEQFILKDKSLLEGLEAHELGEGEKALGFYNDAIERLVLNKADSIEYIFALLTRLKLRTNTRGQERARKQLGFIRDEINRMDITNSVIHSYSYLVDNLIFLENDVDSVSIAKIELAATLYKEGDWQHEEFYMNLVNAKLQTYLTIPGYVNSSMGYLDTLQNLYNEYDRRSAKKLLPWRRHALKLDFGIAYMTLGNSATSIDYLLEAAKGYEENESTKTTNYLYCLYILAANHFYLSQFEQGVAYAQKLLAIAEKLYSTNDPVLVNYYNLLGVLNNGLEKPEVAVEYFQKSSRLLERQQIYDYSYNNTLLNTGESYLKLGKHKESELLFKKALRGFQSIYGKVSERNSPPYHFLADHSKKTGRPDLALAYTDSALQNHLPGYAGGIFTVPELDMNTVSLEVLEELQWHSSFLLDMYEEQNNMEDYLLASIAYADLIQEVLRLKRIQYENFENALYNSSEYKNVTYNAIKSIYHLYQNNPGDSLFSEAIDRMSQNKYMLLNDELGEFRLLKKEQVPDTVKHQYVMARRQIDLLESQIKDIISRSVLNDSIKTLNTQKLHWSGLLEKSRDVLKTFVTGKEDQNRTKLNLTQLRSKHIKGDQRLALVEYFVADTDILITAFSDDKISFKSVDRDSIFDRHLKSFLEEFSSLEKIDAPDSKSYSASAHYLYKSLLKPILTDLGDDINKLILIPDADLSSLPFELLVRDDNSPEGFQNLPYLLNDFEVSYRLSSKMIDTVNERQASKGILGFAYSGEGITDTRAELGDIPGAFEEIAYLKKNFKGSYYVGNQGSKALFLEEAGQYDIIHLAIHGKADMNNRFRSRLIFNGVSDFELSASDLYGLDLNSQMIVLSACESGIGEVIIGEGTFSIARGFALAGGPSIVTTLWEVNDLAGTKIISSFYESLKDGAEKDEALRLAKLDYLANANNLSAHPYYWGSFVMIGDTEPIEIAKKSSWQVYFLTIIILSIVIIWFFRKKRETRI